MVQSVHNHPPAAESQAAPKAPPRAAAPKPQAVPQDKVTISGQAQKSASPDKDRDGDSK